MDTLLCVAGDGDKVFKDVGEVRWGWGLWMQPESTHGLLCLNTWSQTDGTVWGCYGALMRSVTGRDGVAFEGYRASFFQSCLPGSGCCGESSTTHVHHHTHDSQHHTVINESSEAMSQNKPPSLQFQGPSILSQGQTEDWVLTIPQIFKGPVCR